MARNGDITAAMLANAISLSLQKTWGNMRNATKLLARQIDSNERTASNLLEGRNAPSSATLVKLMAADDNVFNTILQLANRISPRSLTQAQSKTLVEALHILLATKDT